MPSSEPEESNDEVVACGGHDFGEYSPTNEYTVVDIGLKPLSHREGVEPSMRIFQTTVQRCQHRGCGAERRDQRSLADVTVGGLKALSVDDRDLETIIEDANEDTAVDVEQAICRRAVQPHGLSVSERRTLDSIFDFSVYETLYEMDDVTLEAYPQRWVSNKEGVSEGDD